MKAALSHGHPEVALMVLTGRVRVYTRTPVMVRVADQ
jgi:hypothetical protein